ncbi:MAG: hypothetical protein AB1584_13360 [Pseudomonadota bacterium]
MYGLLFRVSFVQEMELRQVHDHLALYNWIGCAEASKGKAALSWHPVSSSCANKEQQLNFQTYLRAVVPLFLPFSLAFAQSDGDLAAHRDAGTEFALLVAQAEEANDDKGLQTEEVNQLVAILSDEKRLLKAEQYRAKELEGLFDLCGITHRAVMSLALFRMKEHVDPKAEPQVVVVQVAALIQKNVESFSRQLRHLQPFSIRCAARQVPPMTEFIASLAPAQFTEVRRQGLEQTRAGFAQMFVSVIQSLGDLRCDEAYRLALVQALADSAPAFVSTMPVAVRVQIRSNIGAVEKASPPGFDPFIKQIDKALADSTCDGLCRF